MVVLVAQGAMAMAQAAFRQDWAAAGSGAQMDAAVAKLGQVEPPMINAASYAMRAAYANGRWQEAYDMAIKAHDGNYTGDCGWKLHKSLAEVLQSAADRPVVRAYAHWGYAWQARDLKELGQAAGELYQLNANWATARVAVQYGALSALEVLQQPPGTIRAAADSGEVMQIWSLLNRNTLSLEQYRNLINRVMLTTDVNTNTSELVGMLKSNLEAVK